MRDAPARHPPKAAPLYIRTHQLHTRKMLDAKGLRAALRPALSPTQGPFVRSALTSGLATGSDFIAANSLARAGASPAVATVVGCVVGGLVAFSVNRRWAFRSEGKPLGELVRFVAVWAGSAFLNAWGVSALTLAGLSFALAWAIVRGLVYAGWNYPMLRWFVFRRAQV